MGTVCGFTSGSADAPFTCDSGYNCAYQTWLGLFGCTNALNSALSNNCFNAGNPSAGPDTLICNNASPYCATRTMVYSNNPIHQYFCAQSMGVTVKLLYTSTDVAVSPSTTPQTGAAATPIVATPSRPNSLTSTSIASQSGGVSSFRTSASSVASSNQGGIITSATPISSMSSSQTVTSMAVQPSYTDRSSTTASPTSTPAPGNNPGNNFSTGTIIGLALGCPAALAALGALVWLGFQIYKFFNGDRHDQSVREEQQQHNAWQRTQAAQQAQPQSGSGNRTYGAASVQTGNVQYIDNIHYHSR